MLLNTDLYAKSNEGVPSVDEFEKLRENHDTYRYFLENFVACIAGKDSFRKNAMSKRIAEFVTVSDEAVAHLILKNNYAVWQEIARNTKNGHGGNKLGECIANQLYFVEGKGRGRSWTFEGKKYYNEMYKKIVEDRIVNGDAFDNKILNAYLDQNVGKRRKRNNSNNIRTEEEIECFADVIMDRH